MDSKKGQSGGGFQAIYIVPENGASYYEMNQDDCQHSHHHHNHHQQHRHQRLDNTLTTNHGGSGSGSVCNGKLENNRTTDAQTMMHILKANIGTGVLAMPNAFKNVGLWVGFILVPIIGAICIHCMNILIASHNHLCDRFNYESLDYDQVAALGLACGPKFARRFAKWTNLVVTTFLIFTQVGFCCVYIMFVVENLQVAILNLFEVEYSTATYLMLVFPLIGLTSCTSNLKHLARISTLANILQLTGLALIFFDLLQFHTYSHHLFANEKIEDELSTINLPLANNNANNTLTTSQHLAAAQLKIEVNPVSKDISDGLPLFFATAVYAFEGIGVVLPLIKEMEYPARISGWNGVLNTSMSTVALLYMAMGFFGYAKYGQLVQGSITLNLPETTLNELVRLIFALAIGLSYSLQFYVPWTIMWPHIDESLFYSYRPRESRDKLDILNKLSAENEWAIEESELEHSRQHKQASKLNSTDQQNQQQQQQEQHFDEHQQLDNNSTASTFATSYTMSTCCGVGVSGQQQQQQQSMGRATRRLNLSSSTAFNTGAISQYGSMSLAGLSEQQQQQHGQVKSKQPQWRTRNRLEDVAEQEDDEDSIPEVEWRPPPRSMRGKRKLVRYTVILIFVSFTFVAAALIPRLDLFISLIGALASSCLAIIFPAIIQMCTFWHQPETSDDDDDHHHGRSITGAKVGSTAKGANGKSLLWSLFIGKNLFLIMFGILGLITGTWTSISQLSASYLGPTDV